MTYLGVLHQELQEAALCEPGEVFDLEVLRHLLLQVRQVAEGGNATLTGHPLLEELQHCSWGINQEGVKRAMEKGERNVTNALWEKVIVSHLNHDTSIKQS